MPTVITGTDGVDNIATGTILGGDFAPNTTAPVPLVLASLSFNITTTANVDFPLIFGTLESDLSTGMYNATTGRYTPTVAGYWQVNTSVNLPTSTATGKSLRIRKNGVTIARSAFGSTDAGTAQGLAVSKLVYCNGTTDYIDVAYNTTNAGASSAIAGTLDVFLARSV